MHHEQQLAAVVVTDDRVARRIVVRGVDHADKGVEEGLLGGLETQAVLGHVGLRLRGVPREQDAVQHEDDVPDLTLDRT